MLDIIIFLASIAFFFMWMFTLILFASVYIFALVLSLLVSLFTTYLILFVRFYSGLTALIVDIHGFESHFLCSSRACCLVLVYAVYLFGYVSSEGGDGFVPGHATDLWERLYRREKVLEEDGEG